MDIFLPFFPYNNSKRIGSIKPLPFLSLNQGIERSIAIITFSMDYKA